MDEGLAKKFMRLALRLARLGEGRVSPNPMVGAVLAKDNEVIATGYHRRAGDDHAEVEALKKVGFDASGLDLYVNLEPCCHYGRTPPCVEALLRARVRRVFVAMIDPNPLVSGRGVEILRAHGVEVHVGILEEEARRLNEAFVRYITTGRPFVTLKMAATLDGRIAERSGASRWITGEAARKMVHRMRSVSDAVMVGAKTVLNDDPLLLPTLVRHPPRLPLRVVVDSHASLNPSSQLVRTASLSPVILACTEEAPVERLEPLKERGVEILTLPKEQGGVSLRLLLNELGRRSIQSVLVEGGAKLAASLLAQGLVDRLVLFYAPILLGDPMAFPLVADMGKRNLGSAIPFVLRKVQRLDFDIMLEFTPKEPSREA